MSQEMFPNCRHQCDGQWMLSVGSVTTRPCKCRARQKAIRLWGIAAFVLAVVGIIWALAA